MDDPLSAVDIKVARNLFYNCFRGYLKKKAIVLVIHHIAFLPEASRILALN